MSTINVKTKVRVTVMAAMTSACLAVVGSAGATGIPVVDGAHVSLTMNGWMSQYTQMYAEYAKQLEQLTTQINQLQTQVKQYQQMMVKGAAYKPKAPFRENIATRFPGRGINDGVTEHCGDKPKNNAVGPQQHSLCIAKVRTQNQQFNAMRQFLLDVQKNDTDLEAARTERAGIAATDQGALQANSNKMVSIQSKMENDLQNAKYTMDAYNAVLMSINNETVRLAEEALRNKNGLLNTAVQGAALKLALRAALARDR